MEDQNESSPKVSISADEYFSYKTDKLKLDIEEQVKNRFRKSQIIGVVSIAVVVSMFGSWFLAKTQDELRFVEISSMQAKKSEYLLEEALQKLERSSRDSESVVNEIQLLKKEVLELRLRVEKMEAIANRGTKSE
jgi:CRISPR/Cas system CSM-associated protein Csm4 (group 5 of RAMP superfamily)